MTTKMTMIPYKHEPTAVQEMVAARPERISLREFRLWLEGLLSGNDDPRSLPSLDQWRRVLSMLDRIEDGQPSKAQHIQPQGTGGPPFTFQVGPGYMSTGPVNIGGFVGYSGTSVVPLTYGPATTNTTQTAIGRAGTTTISFTAMPATALMGAAPQKK